MIGFNGGLIGEKRTTSSNASVPGVWTASEQSIARSVANTWPISLSQVIPDQLALELDAALYSGSGNTWADSSGNGRDATLVNSPTYNGSSFDGIFTFVRNSNYSLSPYVTNTNVSRAYTQPYTVTITFRPRSLAGDMRLFGQASGDVNRFSAGFHNWNSSVTPQTIQYRMFLQNDWRYPPTTMVFNKEQWYQVTCVYDGNGYTTMYLNATSYGTVGQFLSEFQRMDIAVRQQNNYGDPFDGDVAHFMIHYKALSASEVSHNFNALRGRFGI